MPEKFNFNKRNINKIAALKKRVEYQDILIPELRLRVSETGTKSFCVYKRLPGSKPVRVTIGKYPAVAPEQAKIKARKILASIVDGVNPNDQKRINNLRKISLERAYKDYVKHRNLKEKTVYGYDTVMKNQLACIAVKTLNEINRETIYKIHRNATAKGQANLAMRLLRAIFNFARNEYFDENNKPLFPDNPVEVLSHRRQWNKTHRRNTHLRQNEIPLFLEALKQVRQGETYTGISICNALLFALLTGLRRSEILDLKWEDINDQAKYFTIKDPKNSLPLELPITPLIKHIFKIEEDRALSEYVFGADNEFGQIKEPKKVVTKVKKLCKADCNFHDLRRTFATTAEHLDIGTYKLKRMMNHASGRDDVTAGYTILTSETLRGSAEKIQRAILSGHELSASTVTRDELQNIESLPQYTGPIVMLGRFAESQSHPRQGLEAKTLVYATRQAATISDAELPAYGLMLDVFDQEALTFYQQFDLFEECTDDPMRRVIKSIF